MQRRGGPPADDKQPRVRPAGANTRQHLVSEPDDRVHVWAIIERPTEHQSPVAERHRSGCCGDRSPAEIVGVDPIGDHTDPCGGNQPQQQPAILLRDGDRRIAAAQHPALVARQFQPLNQRISGSVPATRLTDIGQERTPLQHVLGIELIQHSFRAPRLSDRRGSRFSMRPRPTSWQIACHLDALGLDDIKSLRSEQPIERTGIGRCSVPQRHVGEWRDQRRPGPPHRAPRLWPAHRQHPAERLQRRQGTLGLDIGRERQAGHVVPRRQTPNELIDAHGPAAVGWVGRVWREDQDLHRDRFSARQPVIPGSDEHIHCTFAQPGSVNKPPRAATRTPAASRRDAIAVGLPPANCQPVDQ